MLDAQVYAHLGVAMQSLDRVREASAATAPYLDTLRSVNSLAVGGAKRFKTSGLATRIARLTPTGVYIGEAPELMF